MEDMTLKEFVKEVLARVWERLKNPWLIFGDIKELIELHKRRKIINRTTKELKQLKTELESYIDNDDLEYTEREKMILSLIDSHEEVTKNFYDEYLD